MVFRNVDGSPGGVAFTVFENSSGFSITVTGTNNYTFTIGSHSYSDRKSRRNVCNGRAGNINTIMAGLSASGLKTQIRSYTEVDSNVLSDSVLENIILNAQYRIFRDVPIDAERKQQLGNLVTGQETINAPAGAVIY